MKGKADLKFDPILCDLDGTLVDSAPAIKAALRIAFSKCGVLMTPTEHFSSFIGPPLERTPRSMFPEPDKVSQILEVYRREYVPIGEESTPLMPAADVAIRTFSDAGATLGVVTYKPTALAKVLAGTGLRGLFHLVRGSSPAEVSRLKSELLREALEALHPHQQIPVHIGDHAEDREAAKQCDVPFIAYGPNGWTDIVKQSLGQRERSNG